MMRITAPALLVLLAIGAGASKADQIRGKVKEIDGDKGTITVAVGDVDRTLKVAEDAKIVGLFGKKLKKATTQDLPGGLRGVKAGSEVTLTTEKKDENSLVTQVKVEDLQGKLKKKKKNKNR